MSSKPRKRNAFYAQSGGVTAVINASACGVIETARMYRDRIMFLGQYVDDDVANMIISVLLYRSSRLKCSKHLITLLKEIALETLERLLLVPRTLGAQSAHHHIEAINRQRETTRALMIRTSDPKALRARVGVTT